MHILYTALVATLRMLVDASVQKTGQDIGHTQSRAQELCGQTQRNGNVQNQCLTSDLGLLVLNVSFSAWRDS